jgi:hypothetical protein
MEQLKSLIKSICIISAVICLVGGLISGTRLKSQMKMILNLIFITVVITPVIKGTLNIELPDAESYFNQDYSEDTAYRESLKKQMEKNVADVLMEQIEANGIKCSEIEIDINISETNSIDISSVTVKADDFNAAADVIRNSLGDETEVYNGNQ